MTTSPLRFELWTRPSCSYLDRRREEAIDRLDDLATADHVESVAVRTWGKEVPLSIDATRDDHQGTVRDRVEAFDRWADERDVSLPAFSLTRRRQGRLGPERLHQILPVIVLAVYRDGDLVLVAPHSDGDDHYPVRDALDDLAADTPRAASDTDVSVQTA